MRDVVVIGGGVSGLATAWALKHAGLDVALFERQAAIGGNATSHRFGGFLMDRGPTTINASVPAAARWVARLGVEGETVNLGPGVKRRYILGEKRLYGVSVHPLGFFASNLLSPRARLSLAFEIARRGKTATAEESVHDFVARRFGREFADKVVDPMAAGIFMGDSRQLSITGAFPALAALERDFGSVTRGIMRARRGSEPGRRLFSWREGIGFLPRRLAADLGAAVTTGAAVTGLARTGGGFRLRTARHGTVLARHVVIATQPHVTAALVEPLDPEAASAAGDIPAPPVAVVFLGYRRAQVAHPLDGLGYLGVRAPGRIVSGVQFSSTMFEGRAPAGHVAISAYVGGARSAEAVALGDRALVDAVRRELGAVLGLSGAPVVSQVHRWPRGLPHYTLGHGARREVLATLPERVPGLWLTGNYLGGVSVASCLQSAGEVAGRIDRALAGDRPSAQRAAH